MSLSKSLQKTRRTEIIIMVVLGVAVGMVVGYVLMGTAHAVSMSQCDALVIDMQSAQGIAVLVRSMKQLCTYSTCAHV